MAHPRSRRRTITIAIVASLALLSPALALGGSASPAEVSKVAAAPSACTSAGLVVWINTMGDGTAGSIYYELEFTNLSGHTCLLRGYPGVSGITLAGKQLGSAATRSPTVAVQTVSLASGASASAALQIVDAYNYPNATCHWSAAAGLRVYPPGQRVAKIVPYPYEGCAGAKAHYLSIEAVEYSQPA